MAGRYCPFSEVAAPFLPISPGLPYNHTDMIAICPRFVAGCTIFVTVTVRDALYETPQHQ
jgi:hypothetical protein